MQVPLSQRRIRPFPWAQNAPPCAPPQTATSTNAMSMQHKHETQSSIGNRRSNEEELLRGEPTGSSRWFVADATTSIATSWMLVTGGGWMDDEGAAAGSFGEGKIPGGSFCCARIWRISVSSSPMACISFGTVASPCGVRRFSFEPVRRCEALAGIALR